jgi:hypothetical protein
MIRDFFFNGDGDDERDFLLNNRELITSLIFTGVKEAYEQNLEINKIFKIINPVKNLIFTCEVLKEDWVTSLEKCMEHYLSLEDYETCGEINDLIKKIKNGNNKSSRSEK